MEEGRTTIAVPEGVRASATARPRAPQARASGFYNPSMRPNRDLSVLLVSAFAKAKGREIDVADPLCGAGARALRLAKEVPYPLLVHAGDQDEEAIAAARQGQRENGIGDHLTFERQDAHRFLAARRFDVVDIDPYGSPMPFLDAAVRATRHGGLLCITATDTAALCGARPRALRRRYGAEHGLHDLPWRAEVGLRILAARIIVQAAAHDRAAEPILSLQSGHWMRVVARLTDGKAAGDRMMARLGRVAARSGLARFGATGAGPVWTGPLHEATFVSEMAKAAADADLGAGARRLLPVVEDEARHGDLAFWRRPGGSHAPRRERLIEELRRRGARACQTHLDPQGIRTDASGPRFRAAVAATAKP